MSHYSAPQAQAPPPVKSSFDGINNYTVDLAGLGAGSAVKNGNSINVAGALSPTLQNAQNTAETGISNNLSFLGQSPTQQLQAIDNGQNDFYNLANLQAQRAATAQKAQILNQNAQNGVQNSTAAGAELGAIDYQQPVIDLQNKINAMQAQESMANQNLGTQMSSLGALGNFELQPMSQADSNLMSGLESNNNVGLANNQLAGQIAQTNAQLKMQQQQMDQASMGSLIGGLGSLASIPLMGAFGPMGAMMGGASALSSMFRPAMSFNPYSNGVTNYGGMNNYGGLSSGSPLSPISYLGSSYPFIGNAA